MSKQDLESKIIKKEDYKKLKWKNGLGFTDEIAIFPTESDFTQGEFLWRLSSAEISKVTSFSRFENHSRVLVVLNGSGLRIRNENSSGPENSAQNSHQKSLVLKRFETYSFSGSDSISCETLGDSVLDLSVFSKTGQIQAEVKPVELEAYSTLDWKLWGEWGLIVTVEGELEVDSHKVLAGDTFQIEQNSVGRGVFSVEIHTSAKRASMILISFRKL